MPDIHTSKALAILYIGLIDNLGTDAFSCTQIMLSHSWLDQGQKREYIDRLSSPVRVSALPIFRTVRIITRTPPHFYRSGQGGQELDSMCWPACWWSCSGPVSYPVASGNSKGSGRVCSLPRVTMPKSCPVTWPLVSHFPKPEMMIIIVPAFYRSNSLMRTYVFSPLPTTELVLSVSSCCEK